MNKNPDIFYIFLVIGVIFLFIGVSVQPCVATVQTGEEKKDINPKDYLFLTIIDIADNPDVKELLGQYEYNLFNINVDRKVYRNIFLRNPRLLFNLLLSKSFITKENLDNYYNLGIEITKILGEEKVLKIIESVEVSNSKIFNKLNSLIINNEEISGRLAILEVMNKKIKPDTPWIDNPIICVFLMMFFLTSLLKAAFLEFFGEIVYPILGKITNLFILDLFWSINYFKAFAIIFFIAPYLGCITLPYFSERSNICIRLPY